jgi:hypothetical protein
MLKMEFVESDIVSRGCNPVEFLRWIYGLGYHAYSSGAPFPWKLTVLEELVLPARKQPGPIREAAESSLRKLGTTWEALKELMLVHDSRPVPAVFDTYGPGGRAPV